MSRTLRSLVAVFLASALVASQAAPALADVTYANGNNEQSRTVPVLLDVAVLRPIGMVVTALGAATFCMVAPLVAITRPTDIGAPFRTLVMNPAHYTWVDPLGTH